MIYGAIVAWIANAEYYRSKEEGCEKRPLGIGCQHLVQPGAGTLTQRHGRLIEIQFQRVESDPGRPALTAANPSSSSCLRDTKLFPNRGGRVANRFDCASQLIFGHAKMPRPIFNVILTLDNDLASVRTDFTDHFCGPRYSGRKQCSVGFVPLDGLGGAIDHRAGFNRRAGGSAPCASHLFFWFSPWPCFSVPVGKAHRDPRAIKGPPVLRVRKAIRGRLALLEWRGPKASKVSPAPKGRKGSKDLLVRKALKENRDRPARPGQVCAS